MFALVHAPALIYLIVAAVLAGVGALVASLDRDLYRVLLATAVVLIAVAATVGVVI